MKAIVLLGAVLALLGVIGLAMPFFTTTETKDVLDFGGMKVQAQEKKTHAIPPILSGGVFVVGIVLIGAGVAMNRR
jgi:hypothetical protein